MPSEEEWYEGCGYRRGDEDVGNNSVPAPASSGDDQTEKEAMQGNIESFQDILERAEEAHQAEERTRASKAGTREPLLSTREVTHGDYALTARIAQDLKDTFRAQKGWTNLTDIQRESLDLIATKIARILSGNPNEKDHWLDIAGYAKLVSERL